ncbi:unnamed protein product, partial [Mesorhabditis belari]|uniref:7TM_GPCR_Srx domain-containing protein n=1 Tax=Mesorhabditis belari TaxID=2138241 RepID=A0AAF3F484_9BILA
MLVEVLINGYTGQNFSTDFIPAQGGDYIRELSFGVITIAFTLVTFVLYAVVLKIIYNERDFKQNHSQRIMFHLGIADSFQLLIHASTGVYLIAQYESYGWLEKIQGAIMNGMWCTSLVHTALLAINRAVFIVFFQSYRRIFKEPVFYICMTICWSFFLIVTIVDLTDFSLMVYVLPTYTFQYLAEYPWGGTVREFSNQLILYSVLLAAISYIVIFVYVFTHTAPSKRELLLTIQVFFICSYSVFGYCIWTYCPVVDSPTAYFACNFIWVLWNGINPYIMVLFNRKIREVLTSHRFIQIITGSNSSAMFPR